MNTLLGEMGRFLGDIFSNIEKEFLKKDGDTQNNTIAFTEGEQRVNIESGETHSVLFGKIKKWLSDLKGFAFLDKLPKLTFKYDHSELIYDGTNQLSINIPGEAISWDVSAKSLTEEVGKDLSGAYYIETGSAITLSANINNIEGEIQRISFAKGEYTSNGWEQISDRQLDKLEINFPAVTSGTEGFYRFVVIYIDPQTLEEKITYSPSFYLATNKPTKKSYLYPLNRIAASAGYTLNTNIKYIAVNYPEGSVVDLYKKEGSNWVKVEYGASWDTVLNTQCVSLQIDSVGIYKLVAIGTDNVKHETPSFYVIKEPDNYKNDFSYLTINLRLMSLNEGLNSDMLLSDIKSQLWSSLLEQTKTYVVKVTDGEEYDSKNEYFIINPSYSEENIVFQMDLKENSLIELLNGAHLSLAYNLTSEEAHFETNNGAPIPPDKTIFLVENGDSLIDESDVQACINEGIFGESWKVFGEKMKENEHPNVYLKTVSSVDFYPAFYHFNTSGGGTIGILYVQSDKIIQESLVFNAFPTNGIGYTYTKNEYNLSSTKIE